MKGANMSRWGLVLVGIAMLVLPGCAVLYPSQQVGFSDANTDLQRSTEMLAGQIAASPENLERTFVRIGNSLSADVDATQRNLSDLAGDLADEFTDTSGLSRTVGRVGNAAADDLKTLPSDMVRFLSLLW